MQRFVPQKDNKAVWDNGPSLYADQIQEMVDLKLAL